MASSDKNSDVTDDEIQRPANSKRKFKKIVSSESEEDSDVDLKRKRRIKPLVCESEDICSSEDEKAAFKPSEKNSAEASTDLSDNEQSEKCAICLSKFLGQDIATPETCDHVFCLECLQEWAKNVNTCPIDRLKFNLILIRHHKEEKIIRTIFVNNSELPYNSELESESNTESQINFCELCGEDDSEGTLLSCHECQKSFHYGCIIPTLSGPQTDSWQCPTCDNYTRIRDKFLLDVHHMLQGIKRRFRDVHTAHRGRIAQSAVAQAMRGQHSSMRDFSRVHQRFLYQKSLIRSILSTSESSDEELEPRSATSRVFQHQAVTTGSKARCPLMSTKRRNELYRARNQCLISTATAVASNSQSAYAADSDEGYSDIRLPSPPAPENFDLVGSILQSQSLLHSPVSLSRDGTIFQNSKSGVNQTLLNIGAASSVPSSRENSGNKSIFPDSSLFSDNTVSPFINNAVGKQIPLHSTQNNSKYGETPRQNYSCSTSSAPRERSLSYDECILSGSTYGGSGNERYSNDPNSPMAQKNFCCPSTSDDVKKNVSANKEANKNHHSEDEVDIYSDIESVGEEENSLSDKVEPTKISYKCEESQLSDTNDVSDSTDNELVIDEDMPAEEDIERIAESQGFNYHKGENESSQLHNDQDLSGSHMKTKKYDSYLSSSTSFKSCHIDDTICADSQPHNDLRNDSNSDNENQESDLDVQDEENSTDSVRKSDQGCGSTSCSVKSSPKSLPQCENSISNENEFCVNDNSTSDPLNLKSSSEVNCENENTNYSASQMEVDEYNENNSNVSDSVSQVEHPYKHKKYNFSAAKNLSRERNFSGELNSNDNSQIGVDSNSSFTQFAQNHVRTESRNSTVLQCETNTHFSFASSQQVEGECEPEECIDSNDSNCVGSPQRNSSAFNFKPEEQVEKQIMAEECMEENSQDEPVSNLSFSKYEQVADASEEEEEIVDSNENTGNESNSHFGFASSQQNADGSDVEDMVDLSPGPPQGTGTVTTETINISNDETVKSDNEYEDCDSIEEASTPCLDENLEGEIENSPVRNITYKSDNQDFSRTPDYEYDNEVCSSKIDQTSENVMETDNNKEVNSAVDLGIEDISEAGSEDLDEFPDENQNVEHGNIEQESSLYTSDGTNKPISSSQSNQIYEDHEEGEIIEEKPIRENSRKSSKRDHYFEERGNYAEHAPKMSISELPRIPKLKRNREKDNIPEPLPFDSKRTSVLSRVDLGPGDVSWKRLSKHTRERSYRDGRPKDERLLYRERESRNKDKKSSDSSRRNESKNSDRRRDEKKKSSDKSKSDSRSRRSDKSKETDWDYSDRDKRKSHKDHKDKHEKNRHTKDKKDKHEKNRHSKEEPKYEREKLKNEGKYEREARYDKEDRFDRAIYEKGKLKDKEHKSKRKDRKSESSKICKDHSREKHKHCHATEDYLDKQREVRKVDDKLKIVVGQKDRKEKIKNKDRKESKYEKDLHQRKREIERSTYSEMTSIESKEIFAKGDSIIINVSFNRNSSPKDQSTSDVLESSEQISYEDLEQDHNEFEDIKSKSKNILDKTKSAIDSLPVKRPVTPPERPNQVLSVSESYWQGGDDPDGNNSVTSEKSEDGTHLEDENDFRESPNDANNFSSSSNSTDVPVTLNMKEGAESEAKSGVSEEIADNVSREEESFITKRRSPRSPSPPSPADNDSYDPCEPTKSPSPPPMPTAPPLPTSNPKPPPSPELPPLPPEPEPTDTSHEDSRNTLQNQSSEFSIPCVTVSTQPVTVETQTPSSLAFTGMLLPPPSFLSSQAQNSLSNISTLLPPRTMNYQMNSSNIMTSSQLPPVMTGNYMPSQMPAGTTLPPPPNPPSMAHITSVPPPPPPPSSMGLISQVRHSQMNVQPPLPPNSFLQNLAHNINIPQLQLPPLPHLPPNLCAALANHQSPLPYTSQNQSTSLPCSIPSQQGPRFVLAPNQIPLMPNQNSNNKPHVMSITQMLSHCQTIPVSSTNKSEQPSKPSTPAEKNEVIDMDVDSPYSPGDCSVDSVNDYSPSGSPLPSTPKETGDIFDTLFSADIRTSEKRSHDSSSKGERSKFRSSSKTAHETPSKKSKHEHRTDSKARHSVRMQIEKNKRARKEQKIAEKISKLEDSQLKILDDLPNSAVEMQVKEKFLKKLNRQERVIEEVKLALKPYYKSRDVNKDEYKDILRRAVPKICHNKSGEINPVKVKYLVECYIKKVKHSRKRGDKKKSKFS